MLWSPTAGRIHCDRTSAHPSETNAQVSAKETIVLSPPFCANKSHPFTVKVTLTKYISGWLTQQNMFFKNNQGSSVVAQK